MVRNASDAKSIALRHKGVCVRLMPWMLRVEIERDGVIDVLLAATSPDRDTYMTACDVMATAPESETVRRYLETWKTDREHAIKDALDPWRSAAALSSDKARAWSRNNVVAEWPDEAETLETLAEASALATDLLGDESQPSPAHVRACRAILRAMPGATARDVRLTADETLPTVADETLRIGSFLRLSLREGDKWLAERLKRT